MRYVVWSTTMNSQPHTSVNSSQGVVMGGGGGGGAGEWVRQLAACVAACVLQAASWDFTVFNK
jgi:hypothetical protein